MRTIKFRYTYQHQETGRIMSKFYTLDEIEQGVVKQNERDKWAVIARNQFIGLTDKYITDIYEGDILAHDKAVTIGPVIFEDGGYIIQNDNSWRIPTNTEEHDRIIGNVYEKNI